MDYRPTSKNPLNPAENLSWVSVTVTTFEAALIRKLREVDFGVFIVHKALGQPRRIEITDSKNIEPSEGMKIADNISEPPES